MENYQQELSDKFKTNYIVTRYMVEAKKSNITKASLLSLYLVYANNIHQTYQSANNFLDELYGSHIDIAISIKGDDIIFDFLLNSVSNRYLSDDVYLSKLMEEYLAYIFKPLMENGQFVEKIIDLKKYELKERLKANYDDKGIYAIDRFLSIFAHDYSLGINPQGYEEDLDGITNQELVAFYQELIKQDPIVFLNIHRDDAKKITSALKKQIKPKQINNKLTFYILDNKFEEVIEKQDIVQSKMVLGYTIGGVVTEDQYYQMLLLNSLLGMSSNSYLFKIVREKENLCYSIRSNYDQYSNTIMVSAGINNVDYPKVVKLIEGIINDKLIDNQISDEDLEDAKVVLYDMLRKTNDSQAGIVNYRLNRLLQGFNDDIETDIKKIAKLTSKDIAKMAQKMHLQTKYSLSGEVY
jgi:predicted Zn-dependent peptidase